MALRYSLSLGLLAGLLAVAFRTALEAGQGWLEGFTYWGSRHGAAGWLALALSCATLVLISRMLVCWLCPEAAGSGIPHARAAVEGWRRIDWRRVIPIKFAAGWLALVGGLALGREGPTVQMGAALGEALRGRLRLEERKLLAVGAGAGLTAAFNAPLAGCLFVFEELRGVATPADMFAALVACTAADWVCRGLLGQGALLELPVMGPPELRLLPVFAAVGMLAGVVGVLFNRGLLGMAARCEALFAGRRGAARLWLAVGLVVGSLAWWQPLWVGSGEQLARSGLLIGAFDPVLAAVRFLLTLFSYGLGTPGGIFAPLLVLGAQLGLLVGALTGMGTHASLVVVGMGALVTACVQAPMTAVLLLLEMSGRYAMIFPLTVACACAFVSARALGGEPIFAQLMERDRLRYREEQAAGGEARRENPDCEREHSP